MVTTVASQKVLFTRHHEGNCELATTYTNWASHFVLWDSFEFEKIGNPNWQSLLQNQDWLILTSVASAQFVFDAAQKDWFDSIKIACVGHKTADRVRSQGLNVDLISSVETSQGLSECEVFQNSKDLKILCPKPEDGRDEFFKAHRLRHRIKCVIHYRKVFLKLPESIRTQVLNQELQTVVFFSPSVAIHFFKQFADHHQLQHLKIAVIGKTTENEVRKLGFKVDYCADESRKEGLIQKIFSPTSSV